MSYGAERWAREKCLDFKGDQTGLAVLKEIAFWFLDDEMICKSISQGELAKLLGLKRQQTVADALKRLDKMGLVKTRKIIDATGNITGTTFYLPKYVPEDWPVSRQSKSIFLRKSHKSSETTGLCGSTDLCDQTAEGYAVKPHRACDQTAEGYAVKPQTYTGNKQGLTGNGQVLAPNGASPDVAPWELPLEPPAANYADNTLKTVAQPAEKLNSHTADAPAAKAKPAPKTDRGTRFTLETLPPEWVAECNRIDPELDPQKVFEDFKDYWVALPGAKGRKSDWLATWRNWLRRIRPQERDRLKREVSQFTRRNPVIQLTDEERRRLSQGPVLDDSEDYDHELESELKELLA